MKGKNIYTIFLIIFCVVGLGVTIYFSIQPRSVPKIKFSQVDSAERIGQAVFERLRLEIQGMPLLFFGVAPGHEEDMDLLNGFLAALPDASVKYDMILMDPNLSFKEKIVHQQELDLKSNLDQTASAFQTLLDQGKRVLVVVPHIYAVHQLKGNPISLLESQHQLLVHSFYIGKPVWSRDLEAKMEIPCITGEDLLGTGLFGCSILQKSRTIYRKPKVPGKYIGLMDQTGARDYMILFGKYVQ